MFSNKNWELQIDERFYKELSKFPKTDQLKIVNAVEFLIVDPYVGDIQKIKGEKDTWRRRIGSYRIFYEIHQNKNIIHLFWVERRKTNTY